LIRAVHNMLYKALISFYTFNYIIDKPVDDRNLRLQEYDSELFESKAPYQFIIEVIMFLGRTNW
jgi:hypothetical protein